MRSPTKPAPGSASPWTHRTPIACVYRARGRELLARNGIAGSHRRPLLARAAESPYSPDRATGVLTLRLRARSWHRGSVAQDPGSPSRYGPSVGVRHAAAAAVAAEGASVRLPPYRGLRAEADERPVWVFRVRRRPKALIWISWTGCWSPPVREAVASMSSCCPRARSTSARSTSSKRSCTAMAWSTLDGRGPRALATAGAVPGQLAAHRHQPEAREGRGAPPIGDPGSWFHIRQNKHHRWSLDEGQIDSVPPWRRPSSPRPLVGGDGGPRPAMQFVERRRELTIASLVCEDLAQNDDGRRAHPVGGADRRLHASPRRTAAQFPLGRPLCERPRRRPGLGGADADLVRHGASARGRTAAMPLRVIALWKDSTTGVREIPLEPGAHGVLLTVMHGSRDAAKRRWPLAGRQRHDLL